MILLLIAVIAVVILAVKQRENIQAVIDSRTYSTEELTGKITESKQQVEEAIAQYDLPIKRDFTFEEEEKIRKGELTAEEAMQLIMEPSQDTDESAAAAPASSQAEEQPKTNTADSIVAGYLQQVYGLKAYYIGELGRVESEMRSVYVQSGRNKAAIAGIVQSYMPEVGSLESECDGKIASLLAGMRSDLSAIGADTSIADKIYDAYINEKALRKAYYLSMY